MDLGMDVDINQLELVQLDLDDIKNVTDEGVDEYKTETPFYITSYGADYTVDGLVKRLRDNVFRVPEFQRLYVWNIKQASRFIESLLMGLPVPGIFVFRQEDSTYLIVDGQQRLLSLLFFYKGIFDNKAFQLTDIRKPWNGRSYSDLDLEDRLRLDDAIIHTIVFRQDYPQDNKRSIYEVFERINTGGMKLSPQEIRLSVNLGPFAKLLREMNSVDEWRSIYGKTSPRLKDEELILRYISLLYTRSSYARPMRGFLDGFMEVFVNLPNKSEEDFKIAFVNTIKVIYSALGSKAFRPQSTLNAAVFDAVMIGVTERLRKGVVQDLQGIKSCYDELLKDSNFIAFYNRATADEASVIGRINLAVKAFDGVK